jgi:hypothetical protein
MIARRRHRSLIRMAAIALAALVLLWLSVAISVAGVMRNRQPEIALRFWPGDGQAMAMQSEVLMMRTITSRRHEQEISLAREALAAEPTSARAARILAMLSENQAVIGRRFAYARGLSRRDLFTNLWFIEEAVQRNDVPGALAQYDVTLRTSAEAPRVLFPILNSALAERNLADPIARLLVTGGEWVPDFVDHVLAEKTRAGDLGRVLLHQPQILHRMTAVSQARLIAELADQKQFENASRIYARVSGHQGMALGDAGLAPGGAWPPFDWAVMDTGNYGAAGSPGDRSLQVYAQGGSRGTVARRLIRLDPGAYRLSATATVGQGDAGGEALWSISCADGQAAPIATLQFGGQSGRQTKQASVRIAPGCAWHWLNLEVGSPSESGRFQAAIDGLRIDRLPG